MVLAMNINYLHLLLSDIFFFNVISPWKNSYKISICETAAGSEHPWLKEGGEASDKPIDSAVLSRMKQFRAMNKLKKLALKVNYLQVV